MADMTSATIWWSRMPLHCVLHISIWSSLLTVFHEIKSERFGVTEEVLMSFSLRWGSCFNNTLSAHADVKTHRAQRATGLQLHHFLSLFGSPPGRVVLLRQQTELGDRPLPDLFVLKCREVNLMGRQLHAPFSACFVFFSFFLSPFFWRSWLLWLVARKQYQINAGSYLVTLLISCGSALPCGCCSCDTGDEEKRGWGWWWWWGGGVTQLLLRQQCTHTGWRGL